MTHLPTEQEMEAFLKGKPVSPEFLAELESRTSNLLSQLKETWNLDESSRITKSKASTKDLTRPGADCLLTEETDRKE
jgi:hypothetical protein